VIARLFEEYSNDAIIVFLYLRLPLELVDSFRSIVIDLYRGSPVIEEITQAQVGERDKSLRDVY
jgi:hypothetical protein